MDSEAEPKSSGKQTHRVGKLFCVENALLLLILLFLVSFSIGLNVYFKFSNGLVDALTASDLSAFSHYMVQIIVFLVAPPLAGLIFSIVAYRREMKSPTGFVDSYWPILTIVGIFFLVWETIMIRSTWRSYISDMDYAIDIRSPAHSTQAASLLPSVYISALIANLLWIPAGTLLVASPILKVWLWLKRRKAQKRSSYGQQQSARDCKKEDAHIFMSRWTRRTASTEKRTRRGLSRP